MLLLSKLLPPFVLPLGLTCLFLFFALYGFWKHPKGARICLALGLTILLFSSNQWVATTLVRSLEFQYIHGPRLPRAGAIIVLGGGTKPPHPPRPWIEVGEGGDRILYGSWLYKRGYAPYLIVSGGRISWLGGGQSEAADMAEIAREMGVPAAAILQEPDSLNTHENAINVGKLMEVKPISEPVLLVTSALHMPRAVAIFRHQGIAVIPAPTDFHVTFADDPQHLEMVLLGLLPSSQSLTLTTSALREYMGLGVYWLRGWL